MYKGDVDKERRCRVWFVCMCIITLVLLMSYSKVYAAPSSEDIGESKAFSDGSVRINVHKGSKLMDTSLIRIKAKGTYSYKEVRDKSTEWFLESDGAIEVPRQTNTIMEGKWPGGYLLSDKYPGGTFRSMDGDYYAYLFFDTKITVPRGYYYSRSEADTKIAAAANYLGLPKESATPNTKDRKITGKYHVNVGVTGIRTLSGVRYTGSEYNLYFEPNKTKITYDGNKGIGSMSEIEVIYDQKKSLSKNTFTRNGYTFIGWNTEKDGSGQSFSNGQEITKAFPTETKVTLYAQWKEIKPESVSLDKTIIVTERSQNVKLTATIKPASALNKKVSFTSSDASIVTVSEDGTVIPVKAGKAVVTVRTINGMTSKCRVNVYEEIKEKGLSKIEGFTRNRVNLLAFADKNSETIKVVEKYEDLEIVGQSDNYYYVRMNIDGQYGFATKNEIEIPVVSLKSEGKEIVLQKNWQKKVMLIYIPSITTEKEVSWKSTKTSVATVTNIGVVKGKGNGTFTIVATSKMSASHLKKLGAYRKKKQPIVMSKPGKILTPKNRKWIKLRDIKNKKGQADKMEGLAGVGNTIYFVKIKKSKKGKRAKEIEQRLYSTKITTKKVAVKKGKRVIGYKKIRTTSKPIFIRKFTKLGHVNGMTATKSKGETSLFIAPCKNSKKGIVYRVDISRGKASSPKTITCQKGVGDDLHYVELNNKKIVSIAAWKYKGKIYYILKSGKMNYVCSYKNNHFFPKFTFDTRDAYVVNGNKTSYQGSTCMDSTGKYYVVYSFAYPEDCVSNEDYNKKYKGLSYIFRFNLSIKKNKRNVKQLYVESTASFMFKAGKKVSLKGDNAKKVLKNGVRKLELEDVYTYKGRMYFGSEGGDYYVDLLGRSK